ncbi:organic cation transporter protein isoform X2 [Magallana gigas]
MDYDDVIQELGSFGKFQRRILFFISIPLLLTGFGAPATSFILVNQPHRCKIPSYENDTYAIQSASHQEIINRTIPRTSEGSYAECTVIVNGTEQKCSKWVYDQSQFIRTVTSDFNLVCDNTIIRSHLKTTYLFGFMAASMVSQLSDIFGRRPMLLGLYTLNVIVVFSIPFSISVPMFAALRFFEGLCNLASYQVAFVMVIELVGPVPRVYVANWSLIAWCFGLFLFTLLVYCERNWFYLMLWLAIPTIPPLVLWIPGVITESPRWLLARGRTTEASKILTKMARANNAQKKFDASKIKKEPDPGIRVILRELFHSKLLLKRLAIITSNWFVVSFIYYGLTTNVGSLGGNMYENFALLVLMELAGTSVIFFLNITGRRPVHLVSIFGCCIASIGSIMLIQFAEHSLYWLHILVALVSRFGISALFAVLYVYTGELFPTVVRSIIIGTVNMGARVGSMISPYLYDITDGKLGKMLPLIVYAVLTITVGLVSLRLPETNKRKLTETVEEAGQGCKIPSYENDTYAVHSASHQEIINRTIPRTPEGSYAECTIIVNGTEQKCSEWIYDQSQYIRTVTSDFNLVCDNIFLRSHLKTSYLFGFLVASVVSQLSDIFGRRPMLLGLCTLSVVVVFSIPFSVSIPMFAALRFFEGLCAMAFYQVAFVIVIELVGPVDRVFAANLSKILWCFGEFLLILLVYFERNWFYLMLWLAIPTIPPLVFWIPGVIIESPRWLLARGKIAKAAQILTKIARTNNVQKEFDASKIKKEPDPGIRVILRELFHSKLLLKRLAIITSNWFVVSFIYYGLTMNVDSLGGNLYENFALLVLVELAGYCVVFFLNFTGRRPVHLMSIFGCGIASIVSVLLIQFSEQSLYWLHILVALVSRFGISALFAVLYVYTGELFPTVIRSIVMGTVSIGARTGSMISPYLYDITKGKLGKMLPLIVYAVLTITVGLVSLRLPETNKRKLTETVEEAG